MEQHYVYDEKDCEFKPIEYKSIDRLVHTACSAVFYGVIISAIAIILLSFIAGTPSEIALKEENQELFRQLHNTKNEIDEIDHQINELASVDNELYRSMLGVDPIPFDERQAGVGGSDVYSEFDIYQTETADLLKWAAGSLESIERKINIQKLSFEELKDHYNENQEILRTMPVIRPVKGIILSGYGMRLHPAHRTRRMHHGLDFRASIGTPIYATGEGEVIQARRWGTYGNFLEVDHGFGFKTRYAHLSEFADGIRSGTKVKRGEILGYTGNSGVTTGPHLHYEIRLDNKSVDPLNYLFGDISPEEYREYQKIAENNPMSMD
ncbi:MAG: peptidoglycan DD-metalloendopeptidase family protein [Balneolales bacterium]